MEIVKREDIKVQDYIEIFEKEKHHNHEIIRDDNGTLRWKENEVLESYRKNISLNVITEIIFSNNIIISWIGSVIKEIILVSISIILFVFTTIYLSTVPIKGLASDSWENVRVTNVNKSAVFKIFILLFVFKNTTNELGYFWHQRIFYIGVLGF